jgi:fermentation-respiration switch protein FrsA (DUF1100 family)
MTTMLLAATALYAAFTALIFFSQDRLLFLPNLPGREIEVTPARIGLDYKQLTLDTEDGVKIDAWFIPASSRGPTLLFFHGNAGNISHRLDSIQIFHELALNVLIIDYRGYGRSTGKPSEEGLYQDAEAAWNYLTKFRGIDAKEIVLFGRSLGGAVATWLAAKAQPAAVIVESTFTSVPDMAAKLYPLLPVRWLARLDFNAQENIRRIKSPVLILHSRDDEIVPFEHARSLYEAANEPKKLVEIYGGHNDGFIVSGQFYTDILRRFIEKYLPNAFLD